MKKKKEREPDLIQFKIECSFNEDLPLEKFFMAHNREEALAQLAYSFIKQLPFKSIDEEQRDCFIKAFVDPTKPFLTKPKLAPVPEPIPDMDFPEPEPESIEVKTEKEENGEEEEPLVSSPPDETPDPTVELQPKPDPAAEHLAKQQKRLAEIEEIEKHNQLLWENYEKLIDHTNQMIAWFTPRLQILVFEEYNRWSDSWNPIDYPLLPDQDEDTQALEDEHITPNSGG